MQETEGPCLVYNFFLEIKISGIGLFNTLIDRSIFYNLNDESYKEKTLMECMHSAPFNPAKTYISPGLKSPEGLIPASHTHSFQILPLGTWYSLYEFQ